MNGLKVIRIQCGYTAMDIARKLGVTKQAVSSWERGVKEIPEERRKQLSNIFGLDESYFGEISEEKLHDLSAKAKFMHEDGEHYSYSSARVKQADRLLAYYDGIREMTVSEELIQKKGEQKETEKLIRQTFEGPADLTIREQIKFIGRGIELYNKFVDVVNLLYSQETRDKALYFYRILEMLDGMQKAMGKEFSMPDSSSHKWNVEYRENIDKAAAVFQESYKMAKENAQREIQNAVATIDRYFSDKDVDVIDAIHNLMVENGIRHTVDSGEEK